MIGAIKKIFVMTKQEKNEVIDLLKGKFSQYDNFYITDTESLSVSQVTNLRRHCFDKQVEIKVAKNTLIRKALESLDAEKYAGVYDSLHKVTALMFSENPKDPAVIISGFRKANNNERPVLKAAFINGDVFVGDNQLKALTQIKTKNELIGEVIGLLQSPIQRVLGALQNKDAGKAEEATATSAAEIVEAPQAEVPVPEIPSVKAPVAEAPVVEAQVAEVPAVDAPVAEASVAEKPVTEAPAAETTDKADPEA